MGLLEIGSSASLLVWLLTAAIAYQVGKAVYRLSFHPLAKVPGPWYAAASSCYEFWWDCPKRGRYMFKLEEMHKKYGNFVCSLFVFFF